MATAVSLMNMSSFNNACIDPDVDTYFDFNTIPSPTPTTSSRLPASTSGSAITSPATTLLPLDPAEDQQTPQKPSHEYDRFKQQTGLPSNSVPGIHGSSQLPAQYGQVAFSNSGIGFDDMGYLGGSSLDAGWGSGLGMGSDVNMELDLTSPTSSLPAYFFPPSSSAAQSDSFVSPSAITTPDEPQPNLRVWPGMHQKAALAKAQAQAHQQRHQQLLQQHQQQQQQQQQSQRAAAEQSSRAQAARRSASHQPLDARAEETIARVVSQIRKSSSMTQNAVANMPPTAVATSSHAVRSKKDEEDMDDDERLLASEEGKKLSSKERRQLRNKVSARAFRSRRKEYIAQLEGEVAAKAAETNDLRIRNQGLMEENARCRKFIENLLRHPAFVPFLEDISRDPVLNEPAQIQRPAVPVPVSAPASALKDISPFTVSPRQIQESRLENPQIGMAMIPETPVDISMLTVSNGWGVANDLNLSSFQQPQVYSVLGVPEGPENPLDPAALSGKGLDTILSPPCTVEDVKADYPVIEAAPEAEPEPEPEPAEPPSAPEGAPDECDPDMELYLDQPPSPSRAPAPVSEPDSHLARPVSDKDAPRFELLVSDEADTERLMESLDRMFARIEPVVQRLALLTAHLDA